MKANHTTRSGGQILVDALKIHGVDLAFGVPGESYLAVLDALHGARESIRFVVCRHESGAANMADAYGKLTGRPGVCFVTRGPGATHASVGVHTAFQDSTPMVLFIGQIPSSLADREAFQEVDYRHMFGALAKWVAQIDHAERISEYVNRAFHVAVSGRPGPVVLALPENMLTTTVAVSDTAPYRRAAAHPGLYEMEKLRELLERAQRPLMILGGSGWDAEACADMEAFATANQLPVACGFRRQDLFDNHHDNYVGDVALGINPALAERVRSADLLLAIGSRLGEMTTGAYSLIESPRPKQTLVHVHAGADELERVYRADLAINAGMREFAAAARALKPVTSSWHEWTLDARANYLAWQLPEPTTSALDLGQVMVWLREHLPPHTIICNGAGNYAAWVHRFYRYSGFRTQLAPTSGAMGYGVPAAVAAKLVHPEKPVVCFSGDGCFLMTGQELATSMLYGLPIVFLVVNNGIYGTIRMHQERHYPGRVSGTNLCNPDFAALARSYGAYAEVVEKTADFPAAFERALASGCTALLELRVDPEAITPSTTLSAIRAQAIARSH